CAAYSSYDGYFAWFAYW
nr:immunoglobulin heavy chain junction region [Mus musculus]